VSPAGWVWKNFTRDTSILWILLIPAGRGPPTTQRQQAGSLLDPLRDALGLTLRCAQDEPGEMSFMAMASSEFCLANRAE